MLQVLQEITFFLRFKAVLFIFRQTDWIPWTSESLVIKLFVISVLSLFSQMGEMVFIRHKVYLNNKVTSRDRLPFMGSETCNVLQPSPSSYIANGLCFHAWIPILYYFLGMFMSTTRTFLKQHFLLKCRGRMTFSLLSLIKATWNKFIASNSALILCVFNSLPLSKWAESAFY